MTGDSVNAVQYELDSFLSTSHPTAAILSSGQQFRAGLKLQRVAFVNSNRIEILLGCG